MEMPSTFCHNVRLLNKSLKNRRFVADVADVAFDNRMNFNILKLYFYSAKDERWDLDAIRLVRPYIIDLADIIARRTNYVFTYNIGDILKFKSALVFMSRDIPTAADTLMYSPLMNDLDSIIVQGPKNADEPFKSLDDIWLFRTINQLWYHKDHGWWKILLKLKVDGKVVDEETIGSHQDLKMINGEMDLTRKWKSYIRSQSEIVESRRLMTEIFGADTDIFEEEKTHLARMERVFTEFEKAHEDYHGTRIQASNSRRHLDHAESKSDEEIEKAIDAFVKSEHKIAAAITQIKLVFY